MENFMLYVPVRGVPLESFNVPENGICAFIPVTADTPCGMRRKKRTNKNEPGRINAFIDTNNIPNLHLLNKFFKRDTL
jgi:hypothetical protein